MSRIAFKMGNASTPKTAKPSIVNTQVAMLNGATIMNCGCGQKDPDAVINETPADPSEDDMIANAKAAGKMKGDNDFDGDETVCNAYFCNAGYSADKAKNLCNRIAKKIDKPEGDGSVATQNDGTVQQFPNENLNNAGTSEGAKKGWETRKNGGENLHGETRDLYNALHKAGLETDNVYGDGDGTIFLVGNLPSGQFYFACKYNFHMPFEKLKYDINPLPNSSTFTAPNGVRFTLIDIETDPPSPSA